LWIAEGGLKDNRFESVFRNPQSAIGLLYISLEKPDN